MDVVGFKVAESSPAASPRRRADHSMPTYRRLRIPLLFSQLCTRRHCSLEQTRPKTNLQLTMAANLDANVINALRFLDDVKRRFVHAEVPQLNVYAQFIDAMSEYKSGQ